MENIKKQCQQIGVHLTMDDISNMNQIQQYAHFYIVLGLKYGLFLWIGRLKSLTISVLNVIKFSKVYWEQSMNWAFSVLCSYSPCYCMQCSSLL